MDIQKDNVVTIDYELKDEAGNLLQKTGEDQQFSYLHGHGKIIQGLENVLEGKAEGDEVSVDLKPDQAYGQRNDDLIVQVSKEQFPEGQEIKPGTQVQAQTGSGPHVFTVIEVKEQDVTLDGNHPLAGIGLHFNVNVREVREATEEEKTKNQVL
jgi:FKBP-type peptidyl-prolyl cis-trans isomerase SlyD